MFFGFSWWIALTNTCRYRCYIQWERCWTRLIKETVKGWPLLWDSGICIYLGPARQTPRGGDPESPHTSSPHRRPEMTDLKFWWLAHTLCLFLTLSHTQNNNSNSLHQSHSEPSTARTGHSDLLRSEWSSSSDWSTLSGRWCLVSGWTGPTAWQTGKGENTQVNIHLMYLNRNIHLQFIVR